MIMSGKKPEKDSRQEKLISSPFWDADPVWPASLFHVNKKNFWKMKKIKENYLTNIRRFYIISTCKAKVLYMR